LIQPPPMVSLRHAACTNQRPEGFVSRLPSHLRQSRRVRGAVAHGGARAPFHLERKRLELNGGSLFEPPFEARRRPAGRDHARGGVRLPRARVRRGGHARHRGRGGPLAGQPLSLLPRQRGAAVLLPGSLARSAARSARARAARRRSARRPPPRRRRLARPLPAGRRGGIGGAPRGGRAAAAPARADRRQARSLRARRARARLGRHPASPPARDGRDDRDARFSRRAQLDRPLVSPRRTSKPAADRGSRRRLRDRRPGGPPAIDAEDSACRTPTSRSP